MTEIEKQVPPSSPETITSGVAVLGRLMWVVAGPIVLLGTLVQVSRTSVWGGTWDVVYWMNLFLMMAGRGLEQRSGQGVTLYNAPSTWTHFRNYSLLLLLIGGGAWAVVRFTFSP